MREQEIPREIIASLMLVRYRLPAGYVALTRLATDRLWLRRAHGLRFWKLLGSARGRTFGPWEPRRYGLFAVWDSAAALDEFECHSPVMAAYHRAEELWTVRLAPVRWHGAWGGANPFAEASPAASPESGPWAILTRATIRPGHVRAFRASARQVDELLPDCAGLIASIGLGETPVLAQATFSLWESLSSAQEFAYRSAQHTAAIRRTRDEGWYSEELFARFRPLASCGTWNGVDPLENVERRT